MKKYHLLWLPLIVSLAGCAWFNKKVLTPVTAPQVTTVPHSISTNVQSIPLPPQITVVTQTVAGAIVFVTNTVIPPPILVTNTVLVPGQTVTQEVVVGYSANPAAVALLEKAKGLNSSLNPTPSEPLVNIGLGLLSAALAGYAGWKNRQVSKLQPKVDALGSVIKAVETFAPTTNPEDGTPKEQLKDHITTTTGLDRTNVAMENEVRSITT